MMLNNILPFKKLKIQFWVTLSFCCLLSINISAQNNRIKGALVFRVTELIKLPNNAPVKIGVYNNSEIYGVIQTVVQFGGNKSNVTAVQLNNKNDLKGCNVIYIDKSSDLSKDLSALSESGIIIIADNNNSSKNGWDINIVTGGNKPGYQVHKSNLNSKNADGDPKLFSLASKVYN